MIKFKDQNDFYDFLSFFRGLEEVTNETMSQSFNDALGFISQNHNGEFEIESGDFTIYGIPTIPGNLKPIVRN